MKNKITKLIPKVLFALCLAACFCGSPVLMCFGLGPPPRLPYTPNRWLTDERDGKNYFTFIMPDGKIWMAQNLNFETESGSWCYDNDEANCNIYGRLYDWNTAMTACPQGWRLPTDEEWQALISWHGRRDGEEVAGTKMKSMSGWAENGNGTNYAGFTALPGGYYWNGNFYDVGYHGYWWTTTENDAIGAWFRGMGYHHEFALSDWFNKAGGFSVRCIRDRL